MFASSFRLPSRPRRTSGVGVGLLIASACTAQPPAVKPERLDVSLPHEMTSPHVTQPTPTERSLEPKSDPVTMSTSHDDRKLVAASTAQSNISAIPERVAEVTTAVSAAYEPPSDWREQWREALRLYKQTEYELACPLFHAAAEARATNAALWGDLGLCEHKLGRRDEAVQAALLAVRYGDSRVRRAAYHNLGLASFRVDLPDNDCATLPSTDTHVCAQPLHACVRAWRGSGTVYRQFGALVTFSRDEKLVREWFAHTRDFDLDVSNEKASIELQWGHEQDCDTWCSNHPEFNHEGCEEGCLKGSDHELPHRDCDVVYIDACNRRVGYVCWTLPVKATYEKNPRTGYTPRAFEFHVPELESY